MRDYISLCAVHCAGDWAGTSAKVGAGGNDDGVGVRQVRQMPLKELRASRILCKRSKVVRIEQIISGEQLRFKGLLPCGHINGKEAACQGSATQFGILSA